MDNKKFKKQFKVLVPVTDKANALVLEPGTKGIVILSDATGKLKIAADMNDLIDAIGEVKLLAALYTENKEAETIVEGALLEGDEE